MKRPATIPLALALLLLNVYTVAACVCEGTPGVAAQLEQSDAVFSGKLVAAGYRKGDPDEMKSIKEAITGKREEYETLVLTFRVERWWKGGGDAEVTIHTSQTRTPDGSVGVSDCDYTFKLGGRYLVYSSGPAALLRTGACTRTRPLGRAKGDLRALGGGRKPVGAWAPPQRLLWGTGGCAALRLYAATPNGLSTNFAGPTAPPPSDLSAGPLLITYSASPTKGVVGIPACRVILVSPPPTFPESSAATETCVG
jgi:hypothetical protein